MWIEKGKRPLIVLGLYANPMVSAQLNLHYNRTPKKGG